MRKGEGRGPARPISWCIGVTSAGGSSSLVGRHDPSRTTTEDPRSSDLSGRGLARSTSYQALHSALARLYRIDDFTMERIGSGFFSEVFKVRHRVTGDVMVLKMNKLISNRHNMLREVELMNRLHHPNILRYYGVCVNEGQVHALTEYINGGSLDSLIGNQAVFLTWATRVSLALDIARGMAYLHSKGVFHRDLTSKNVLIKSTQEGGEHKLTAVIADFGLAAPIPHEKCMRLRQVGSPYWMAPEVIRGDWYDHRVDVFSFGIIVCELIARCEADPDILPRTHNFGVHYLDFYQMCQQDCPALFLQLAFQCCQIEPSSRPTFEELTVKLESLLSQLTAPSLRHGPRKLRVCHRRSLSDDTFKLLRGQVGVENVCLTGPTAHPLPPLTPQEIVEKMSAADPYFQPSTGTVNPFAQVKLPARSQLALQEGGRYCHSLPDYPGLLVVHSAGIGASRHVHTSDSCLCPHASSSSPSSSSSSSSHCQCANRQFSSQVDRRQCQCLHGANKRSRLGEGDCKWRPGTVEAGPSTWHEDAVGNGGTLTLHGGHYLGPPVRRRGSGESGFFSVGDAERAGTPELRLSYSELSTASLASDDAVQRSSSVVTDSSEDLSSLGCCHDPSHDDPSSSLCEGEEPLGGGGRLSDYDTDIRQIVDFFERNVGPSSEGPARRSAAPPSRGGAPRQGCLVPLLTHKLNALHAGHRLVTISSPPCPIHHRPHGGAPPQVKPCSRSRDAFKVKDRPKVYVTEGTVRAKRDIFEAK